MCCFKQSNRSDDFCFNMFLETGQINRVLGVLGVCICSRVIYYKAFHIKIFAF